MSSNNQLTLINNCSKSLILAPVTPNDILFLINSLETTKEPVDITTVSIKHVMNIISPILSHIFNLYIEQGVFPSKLKKAVVKRLFKKMKKPLKADVTFWGFRRSFLKSTGLDTYPTI